ncbi:MAG: helix-hairpin-helix domain-containing protein [Ruminococcus sp.]|nr:helix-hairpin-helix domain-containing protein [Ruminococcus sp.]
MKKILKRPELLLIALGLILLSCSVLAGYYYQYIPQGTQVIYVSEADKAKLISDGKSESVIINLNTATIQELCQIDGIGEKTAQAIIDYRNENGGFNTVDELMNIKGIGEKTFKSISPYVCIG